MTRLEKLIQEYNPEKHGAEYLNDLLKEALLVERKYLVAQKALELTCTNTQDDTPDYWIDEAVKVLNEEENAQNKITK